MSKLIYQQLLLATLCATIAPGADTASRFLGANSCASSSCHGGGGANQNQFLVWSLKDFHSHRPPATLTTARSKQIADVLEINDPATDRRCTTCHAPLREVPDNQRGADFSVSEGISCESCHGPAENWLRSHTRHDWTRANRTTAGMRDLQSLYVRAGTCVACHQNLDLDVLKAGHPELMFELDGQSAAEPKHWRPEKNGNGAQAWLAGQAVALREMSWQLTTTSVKDQRLTANQTVLFALLKKAAAVIEPTQAPSLPATNDFAGVQKWADDLARSTSDMPWNEHQTRKCLTILSTAGESFGSPNMDARYAGRLVLALDRLVTALPELQKDQLAQNSLNQLFTLAQSIPDFDATQFAAAQADFSRAVARALETGSSP